MQCKNCGRENSETARFCANCGAPLQAVASDAAELRQLTVLFCDLVGSTKLAEFLEPEDLRELTGTYHSVCDAAIIRHDGHIAQYLGDGVVVYFGYPIAHEDDARRAVRAALEIVADLSAVAGRSLKDHAIALNARLGIHTGPVIVGEIGGRDRREQLAVGKTPNVAARIQNIAGPGEVVVSDATYRIVRGFFDFTPLGPHEIKGLSEAITLHRVLRESGAQSRLDAERRTGLTSLTGRDAELRILDQAWDAIPTSGSHAVLVQGEAGIGKSRIVDSLRARVERQQGTVLECFCSPYAQNAPLFPIVEQFERGLGFTRETTDAEKRTTLERRLERQGILTEETFALMAELLSISLLDAKPLVNYSPQKRRERTLETLLAWLMTVAHDGPTLWVVEDLHWMDPTSLSFVSLVLESLSTQPLLVILTFRPDFAAPWRPNGRVSSMLLNRLAPSETTSMALSVAQGKAIPVEVLSQIVERSEGVPLFVEEVTKAVLELGVLVERDDRFEISGRLPPDLIPSTVQDSLNSRLDRLGPAKVTAQLAATIGREFSYALLMVVAEKSEAELKRNLDLLLGAELVYRRGDSPEQTYLFKHALVRDVAYASLPKRARRTLHERIAQALTSRFPETAAHNPELVAEHFSMAGRAEQAVEFWLRAGRLAVERAANHEAITHLSRGLAMIAELPERDRHAQELEFLVGLMPALIAAEGWTSAQLERIYRRAEELVALLGETPHGFTVLAGEMGYHFVGGRVTQSLVLARRLLELASAIGDPLLLMIGRQNCSAAHCYHGDFRLAVEHAEAGLAMLDLERERLLGRKIGLSPCVGILAYINIAFWMLAFPERSKHAGERGLALALEIGHPPSIGFALTAKTGSSYLQGDAKSTLASADEALRLAREERLGFWEPMINVFRGWAVAELGARTEGTALIRDAIKRYREAGNGIQQIWFYAILAETQWKSGDRSDAFATLATARPLARENGEALFEPELYRLEGEFLLAEAMEASTADCQSRLADAERHILEALDLARCQDATMLELRSLVSLCSVRRKQGDVAPARDELRKVYQSFTEGFEAPDLREARAMLEATSE